MDMSYNIKMLRALANWVNYSGQKYFPGAALTRKNTCSPFATILAKDYRDKYFPKPGAEICGRGFRAAPKFLGFFESNRFVRTFGYATFAALTLFGVGDLSAIVYDLDNFDGTYCFAATASVAFFAVNRNLEHLLLPFINNPQIRLNDRKTHLRV